MRVIVAGGGIGMGDAGVDVRLRTVADSVHSFVLFDFLPEADEALADFAAMVGAGSARVQVEMISRCSRRLSVEPEQRS